MLERGWRIPLNFHTKIVSSLFLFEEKGGYVQIRNNFHWLD